MLSFRAKKKIGEKTRILRVNEIQKNASTIARVTIALYCIIYVYVCIKKKKEKKKKAFETPFV